MSRKEILRNQRWRIGIIRHAEEVTHNIAKICRYFGISRTAFYRRYKRYKKYGVAGLKDRSHRPIHSPNTTQARNYRQNNLFEGDLSFWSLEDPCVSKSLS